MISIQEMVCEPPIVDVVTKELDHLLAVVHADITADLEPRVDDRFAEADSAAEVEKFLASICVKSDSLAHSLEEP
jgi:hypothetical protein